MKNEKDEIIPSAKTPRPLKAFRKLTTTITITYNIDSIYLSHHRISQPQYPLEYDLPFIPERSIFVIIGQSSSVITQTVHLGVIGFPFGLQQNSGLIC